MARRVDNNQAEIVSALREFGAMVADTHSVGHGFPDLCVSYGGRNYLMEVKSEHGKLTPDEVKFHNEWKGIVNIVYSIEDALSVLCNGVEDDNL